MGSGLKQLGVDPGLHKGRLSQADQRLMKMGMSTLTRMVEQQRNPSSIMIHEKGNNVNHGSFPDFQQDASVTVGITKTNMERGVIGEVAEVNHNLILKRSDDSEYLKRNDKNVKGADGASRPKPKCTRIKCMESGLVSSEGNDFKQQLGKRKAMQYADESNYENLDAVVLKQQKVDGQKTIILDRSARVETHPRREQ